MKWPKQFVAVAANSFNVLAGDPLTLIIHVLIVGVTLAIACMPGFSNIGGQMQLVRDQSLALSLMALSLLAAVGIGRTFCDDMTKGMMPTIMSRPVPPSALIAGKWAGVVGAVLLLLMTATTACLWSTRIIHYRLRLEALGLSAYLAVAAAALLLPAVRHYFKGGNYIHHANLALALLFPLAFIALNFFGYNGKLGESFGYLVDWRAGYAFAYIAMPMLVYTAIIVFLATKMDVSLLMVCSAILFFGGLFSAYLVNLLIPYAAIKSVVWIFVPNLQLYWIPDDVSSSTLSSHPYLIPRLANAILKSLLFLFLATASFKRLEIKGSI